MLLSRVVVSACSDLITDEAMQLLRSWEEKNRRHLLFLDAANIAGNKLRLQQKR